MIYPKKLKKGDHVRIIAPSRSFNIISDETREIAIKRFEDMGLKVSYSKHCDEIDDFASSSIISRIADLHEAFTDPNVDAIITAIGGFNTNQLIDKLDYELIKNNPKILCGFSDITCLCHAITSQTGLVTYSGPHFSSFGMEKGLDYTIDYFKKCFMTDEPYSISPSDTYSDDPWFLDQEKRTFIENEGFWIMNSINFPKICGKLIGGHVRCLSSLQGTKYWTDLNNSILFIEEDEETNAVLFDRLLQSLIHQNDFKGVQAVIIGRFQKVSNISRKLLEKIIASKSELKSIPIIANVDFGHTTPIITYPIGGEVCLSFDNNCVRLKIVKH